MEVLIVRIQELKPKNQNQAMLNLTSLYLLKEKLKGFILDIPRSKQEGKP